jgi:hypothetical protein
MLRVPPSAVRFSHVGYRHMSMRARSANRDATSRGCSTLWGVLSRACMFHLANSPQPMVPKGMDLKVGSSTDAVCRFAWTVIVPGLDIGRVNGQGAGPVSLDPCIAPKDTSTTRTRVSKTMGRQFVDDDGQTDKATGSQPAAQRPGSGWGGRSVRHPIPTSSLQGDPSLVPQAGLVPHPRPIRLCNTSDEECGTAVMLQGIG